MRLFDNTSYPFLSWRRRAYLVFAVAVVAGIVGMVVNVARGGSWVNYGVEFTGGTLVQVDFARAVPAQDIRAVAESAGEEWEISQFGEENQFVFRMGSFEQTVGQDAASRVTQVLQAQFDPSEFRVVRTDAVGPKVGDELQQRALLAIVLSFMATLVYLAFRFEWRFGLAAILATLVDVLVALGYLSLTRTEVQLGTVAALLTIVGYSLNDKIVVFDRIRENLAAPKRGEGYLEVLNRSINETLSRTALTGGGTLATLLALFFLGGPVIRDFALVLILGIVIGTFSSIFVGAPILYEIEQRSPRFGQKKAKDASATGSARRAATRV